MRINAVPAYLVTIMSTSFTKQKTRECMAKNELLLYSRLTNSAKPRLSKTGDLTQLKFTVMEKTFTIAHLSDFHLSSLKKVKIQDLLNKRIFGYLKWQLHRRSEHKPEVLEALLRDLQMTDPDHIVVTGDLTHLALPAEFQEAKKILHSMGSPRKVTVIPGNHDAYVKTDWNSTFLLWTDYMAADKPRHSGQMESHSHKIFPSLRIRDFVALVGLTSARPSGVFFAVGSVGKLQLQELEKILAETGQRQLFRIVLIHHPPLPGMVSWRKRLTDGEALSMILKRQGVELVLHGHAHRDSQGHFDTTAGQARTMGVSSASAPGRTRKHRARYHIYRLKKDPHGWEMTVSVRCYSPPSESFAEETETHFVLPRPMA
jgi:3',5'-cyclic AMP phosphodiesterase CpdA